MQTASQTASQTEVQTDQPIQNRQHCRHINLAGGRCGSPALRGENFCFYHHATRRAIPPPTPGQPHHLNSDLEPFALPVLEDRASIQLAISQVVARIASNDLDLKRARLLLFGLQIAIRALPREESEPARNHTGRYTRSETADTALDTDQIEIDPHLGPLAPIADYTPQEAPRGFAQRLLEELKERRTRAQEESTQETIPTIQAVATQLGAPDDPGAIESLNLEILHNPAFAPAPAHLYNQPNPSRQSILPPGPLVRKTLSIPTKEIAYAHSYRDSLRSCHCRGASHRVTRRHPDRHRNGPLCRQKSS
jgi:hypothetical protein